MKITDIKVWVTRPEERGRSYLFLRIDTDEGISGVGEATCSGGGGSVNASLSKWTKKKAFELNVEIGVALALSRSSPPGSYDKKLVYSLDRERLSNTTRKGQMFEVTR